MTEFDPGEGFQERILGKIKQELKDMKIDDVWSELGWQSGLTDAFDREGLTDTWLTEAIGTTPTNPNATYHGELNAF